ncbi:MAG: PfkB family carbohydrate kinase, partial [Chloroflexota bacterium]|nr:PfkB family carbohydrate kinase [Chloroflexota bacterium]
MIVVIGSPRLRRGSPEHPSEAAGLAAGIALAAVSAGRQVQLVGRVGEDPAGEALLLALARAGIGHAATLRDAVFPTSVVLSSGDVDPDLLADPTDDA